MNWSGVFLCHRLLRFIARTTVILRGAFSRGIPRRIASPVTRFQRFDAAREDELGNPDLSRLPLDPLSSAFARARPAASIANAGGIYRRKKKKKKYGIASNPTAMKRSNGQIAIASGRKRRPAETAEATTDDGECTGCIARNVTRVMSILSP